MSKAVVARKQGDDFQARLFWLHAALLLDPNGPVTKVGYETGPKAFDDVLVEFDPTRAPQDHRGRPVLRDHLQCKWHVRPDHFGYGDLIVPDFIGAHQVSFLQRARDAQRAFAPAGDGARFKLVTNWRLNAADPLVRLVLLQWHALDVDQLFDGGARSAMGRVREEWRSHLGIDDAALRLVASTLGITQRLESADDLRERLNDRFAAVGMVRVPADEAGFFYDDLIAKLHSQSRTGFDRDAFREMCKSERLLDDRRERNPVTVGVRSFMHPIDDLAERCDQALNLVPFFDGRYIKDEADWNARVWPEVRAFVVKAARANDHLRLVLDTHVSLAFAVGTLLDVKSGKRIEIEQRTGGKRFWAADDMPEDPAWPKLEFEDETLGDGVDVAIAVGLTHDIAEMARNYVKHNRAIGRLTIARPQGGHSGSSVRCGHHAAKLAEAVTSHLRAGGRSAKNPRTTHVFIAGPNGFAFFLGQNHAAIGPCVIYEWDFDGKRGGDYSPGLAVG